jgi:DNA-binding LacI/PurR family transcriptional regulator
MNVKVRKWICDVCCRGPADEQCCMAEGKKETQKEMTIGAILFGRDSFFENIQRGMETAANEAGVKLLVSVHDHDIAKETSL